MVHTGLWIGRSRFESWLGSLCCSWASHFTLIVPLSTQVYKWVPVMNLMLGGGKRNPTHERGGGGGGGGAELHLIASCLMKLAFLAPPQLLHSRLELEYNADF